MAGRKRKRRIKKGHRFGKLVVLASWWQKVDYPSGTKNVLYYKCKCDCGNERIIRSSELARGQKSCGCVTGGFKDLTGQRFNNLVALKYLKNSKRLCRCDCGNTTKVRAYELTHNKIKSCGHCGKDSRNPKTHPNAIESIMV